MFFRQVATITPFIREGSGGPIYGQPEVRKCRMERGKHLGRADTPTSGGSAGTVDQTIANARMFCTGAPIPERSLVSCDGQDFIVINCDVMTGFADNHLEVYLE